MRNLVATVLLLAVTTTAWAQEPGPVPGTGGEQQSAAARCREHAEGMRQALRATHERQRTVGLAAAVLVDGELVLSEGLGYADLEHQVPVTRETRFGVASVTKAFTGVALLKLREAGRLDLDAPIQQYVPAFPAKASGTITPRLLAAHLAGIRHWGEDERTPALYAKHFDDVINILPLFKDDALVAPPGTAYNYSSYGYNLLAMAIQTASGERFQDYVARVAITPLGLRGTGFDDVRRALPHRARRYSYYEPTTFAEDTTAVYRVPEWDYSHNMGGGNMYSTAEDLARFGRALMRPGLLSQSSLDLLYTRPRTATAESRMSFGWFVRGAEEGPRRIHINGSNAGVQAAVHVYPDHDLVTVILSNTWGVGSRSGEMGTELPERVAAICMGWPEPGAPKK